jgi:hypothetical protein
MERAKVVRGLRIAFSTICVTIWATLAILWAWSYSAELMLNIPRSGDGVRFNSRHGNIEIGPKFSAPKLRWQVNIPYAIPVLVSAALAVPPWIRWRWKFSLRTLLITTTLIAAVLGLVVWAGR